jgi:hypothetical protein
MKKLLGILVLGLLLISAPANAGTVGSGELKIGETTFNAFLKYLRGGTNKVPDKFLVTLDGKDSYHWYCSHGTCVAGGDSGDIKVCELHFDKECKVFAKRRTIRWKNGINKGGKQGKINSKWSDSEIRAKLTELGFLGGTTSTTTKVEKKKKEKKTEETKTTSANLTEELKELNKLYEDGVLTKEEFGKAKKKLLN